MNKNNLESGQHKYTGGCLAICLAMVQITAHAEQKTTPVEPKIESMTVWATQPDTLDAGYTSPVSTITPQDMASINIATTEDVVKFEPSLVIRRRFIGDSNGTLGIRGSNMFQTARSMVFADGVPLHYLLQSRWNGAPRWTMVSASEIAQVEILYGPFSAEYSGNSMGGVVLIETAIPERRQFHMDGTFYQQSFDAYGFDDTLNGFKGFASFGDKVGNWSYYLSYNHQDNEAQPQTFRDVGSTTATTPEAATGGINGHNSVGNLRYFYGDTGVVNTTTQNYKFKAGYQWNDWSALLNIAYEDRASDNTGSSYLRELDNSTIWSGEISQDGQTYQINSSRLNHNELERDSLSIGLRIKGELNPNLKLESNISQFSVLNDESRSSSANPADSVYDGSGQVADYDDTGWQTADIKLRAQQLGGMDLTLVTGIRWEHYELHYDVYDSTDYRSGLKTDKASGNGGETSLLAGFAQINWDINPVWDTSLGLRLESWESENGYYLDGSLNVINVPGNSADKVSPKFSLGYKPGSSWIYRYSLAKAYRFPIVEELYSQYKAYNSQSFANPELKPEDGLHHNLLIERKLEQGYIRANLYWENINQTIESQTDSTVTPSVRTFVPIDEVETKGFEFIVNRRNLFIQNLDARFNVAYTDSTIVKNTPDPSLEGNRFPRMPKWRANLLTTYHLTPQWDVGVNWQYASDSYGRLDNSDMANNVYGAQDSYNRIGLKTTYFVNQHYTVGLGIDNLTNEVDYVAHPWPGRTLYANFSVDY